MKMIDLTGQLFGRWTVLSRAAQGSCDEAYWLCRCDCGSERAIKGSSLRRGDSTQCRSCKWRSNNFRVTHGHARIGARHPLYTTWEHMWQRCTNQNNPDYKDYGGRGITVCSRWKAFALFLADMGERPENLSIDRIDNDGNYEPVNCRWATSLEQRHNQRRSREAA